VGAPSYTVPSNGVLTSFTTRQGASSSTDATMRLYVFHQTSPGNHLVVGRSNAQPLTPNQLNPNLPAQVSTQAGDLLGLQVNGTNPLCLYNGVPGDQAQHSFSADPQPGSIFTPTVPTPDRRWNIEASLEPDCDNDGLGDETQDTNLSSCAPGTIPTGPAPTLPSGAPATCKGKPATIVGTNGSDVRTGSQGPDVIVALGGNDTLSGLADNDVICGGRGKDKLKGGADQDTLLGQKGRDKLKGGGGADLCKGGKGKDTASKCEVEKSI
jgi:RTX calcium-binding nonapeptide repeat (4 copies)